MSSDVLTDNCRVADSVMRRESALHYCLAECAAISEVNSGVVLLAQPLKGHLNLRGNPEDNAFVTAASSVLAVDLPIIPGHCVSNSQLSVYWLGPGEWLIIVAGGQEGVVENRLRQAFDGHFAVSDISGGQILINLAGNKAEMVLKKSSAYDFHPSVFTAGRCVQTTFAKATALVSKKSDGSFDLVIRRSFADYLFKWIRDASQEYGFSIKNV